MGYFYASGAASGGAGEIASDDFESYSADADLASQANWDTVIGAMIVKDVSGNKVAKGNSSTANSACVWAGSGTFNADQYSEGTIQWASGVAYIAVAARIQAGVETYYRALALPNSSQVRIDKYIAGTQTVGTTVSQGLTTGNRLRIEVTGVGSATRITVKVDTGSGYTSIITSDDPGATYIDGGKPGLSSYDNNLNAGISAWAGGNL